MTSNVLGKKHEQTSSRDEFKEHYIKLHSKIDWTDVFINSNLRTIGLGIKE